MAQVDSDEEILEFAISREVEAYHFYMTLAERTKRPDISRFFVDLATEELEHKARLELEVVKRGRTVVTDGTPPASGGDFVISNEEIPLDIDYREMLLLAMEKEEASFRTYVNLLPNVHDEDSRNTLLALAQEEVRHKLGFEDAYEGLLKGK